MIREINHSKKKYRTTLKKTQKSQKVTKNNYRAFFFRSKFTPRHNREKPYGIFDESIS